MKTILEVVELSGRRFEIERPCEPEALLDEGAFAVDEFLPYWAESWPSGLALARHIGGLRLHGLAVLELGCGLGLPSLVAASLGADTMATDWADDALALLRANAERNNVSLETSRLDWRAIDAAGAQVDVVLAADVLYEARNVQPVLACLDRLVRHGGFALVADPGRRHADCFLGSAPTRGWSIAATSDALVPHGGIYRLTRS